MAFKQVFYALQEVFPQVDLRILKAVASQYSSDVDAAVEFVLSDVLPVVSEPTEPHYVLQDVDYTEHGCSDSEKPKIHGKSISLADQRATEDANILSSPSAGSNNTFGDSNASPDYFGALYINNKKEGCSKIEDKVVMNESRTTPTVECAQFVSSSTPSIEPFLMEYETSASRAFASHSATENEKVTTSLQKVEHIDNHENSIDNFGLSDSFASSESVLPLFKQSLSDCRINYEGQMPLKFIEAENTFDFSKSEDNYKLEHLFVNFCTTEDGQTPKNLPNVSTIHELSKSEDDYHLLALFENIHATDNTGQVLDIIPCAENYPELHKSEDYNLTNIFGRSCTVDSSTQVPRFHQKAEHEQYFHKLDYQYNLLDLVASSKSMKNSLRIFEEMDNSHTTDGEERLPIDFIRREIVSSTCNLDDSFNLSELFSSTQSIPQSALDPNCEARDKTVREILGVKIEDKQSSCRIVESVAHLPSGMNMMPGKDRSDEFLDITTKSNQISQINKFISDFSKSKDALCSLYESTIIKMKEIELLEENSELEKQAAAKAHKDFLAIVEHFNQLIENSNMSNDKQAQIVREENSLLAALAQELQSRLSNMSAQRDESLTIIEEIKFELDAQLATLMEEEAAARQQISQEEKLAELVRKENEAILENIMKESQKLQKEAEENILLRGFLLDRTGMIDALQGEISSIHSNVMALKERTHRNNFKSAVVSISNLSASTYTAGSKGTSASGDRPLGNDNYIGLPQEQMIGNHSKHDVIPSDDEWEVLGTAET